MFPKAKTLVSEVKKQEIDIAKAEIAGLVIAIMKTITIMKESGIYEKEVQIDGYSGSAISEVVEALRQDGYRTCLVERANETLFLRISIYHLREGALNEGLGENLSGGAEETVLQDSDEPRSGAV